MPYFGKSNKSLYCHSMFSKEETYTLYNTIYYAMDKISPECAEAFRHEVLKVIPDFNQKSIKKLNDKELMDFILLIIRRTEEEKHRPPPPLAPYKIRQLGSIQIAFGEVLSFYCNRDLNRIAILTNDMSFMLCEPSLKFVVRLFCHEFPTDETTKLLFEDNILILQAKKRMLMSLSIEKIQVFSQYEFDNDIIYSVSSSNGKYIGVVLNNEVIYVLYIHNKCIKLLKSFSECFGAKSISFSNDNSFIIFVKNYSSVWIYSISLNQNFIIETYEEISEVCFHPKFTDTFFCFLKQSSSIHVYRFEDGKWNMRQTYKCGCYTKMPIFLRFSTTSAFFVLNDDALYVHYLNHPDLSFQLPHSVYTKNLIDVVPHPTFHNFVFLLTAEGIISLWNLATCKLIDIPLISEKKVIGIKWGLDDKTFYLIQKGANIVTMTFNITEKLCSCNSCRLFYSLNDNHLTGENIIQQIKSNFICATDVETIIEVRTKIIWAKISDKKRTSYDDIKNIMKEYTESSEKSLFLDKICRIQEDLLYFISFMEYHPDPGIHERVLNETLTFQESNEVLYYLWHEGEKWNYIAERVYGKPELGEMLKTYVYNSTIYKTDASIITSLTYPTSASTFSKAKKKIVSLSFKEAVEKCLESVCQNVLMCPNIAYILNDLRGFDLSILLDLIQKKSQEPNIMLFIQWCIMFNVFKASDTKDFIDKTNMFYLSIPTTKESKTSAARIARLKGFINVIPPHVLSSTEHRIDQFYNDITRNTYDLAAKMQKLEKDQSIIFDILQSIFSNKNPSTRLQAFEKNIFMLSPSAYYFIRSLIPSLHGKSWMQKRISTELKELTTLYTMSQLDLNAMDGLLKILYLRMPKGFEKAEHPIPVTVGGDAAAVVNKESDSITSLNLYCFEILPLDYEIKPFPLQYYTFKIGAAPKEIRKRFSVICKTLSTKNIDVVFKSVDGETTMNKWFSKVFSNLLEEIIHTNSFKEVIEKATSYKPFPVSDMIHLFKCARAHVQGHLTCVDPQHFICVNVEMMKVATGLDENLNNRSSNARMMDQLALELFSWEAFVLLIKNQRMDAAFYCMPFVFLNEAVRGKITSKSERLKMLEMSYKVFLFHYDNIKRFSNLKMFPQKYSSSALGTLFGEKVFIQRCLCTTIAFGIGITLNLDRIGLQRIGTYILECNFGEMRKMQRSNNNVSSALNTAAKTTLLLENNQILDLETKINTRENNGGVKLDKAKEARDEELFFNPDIFPDIIYNLMVGTKIDENTIYSFIMQMNSYTKRYQLKPTTKYKNIKPVPAGPLSRYLTLSGLRVSTIPILPDNNELINTPLSFYYPKLNKAKQRAKIAQYCATLMKYLNFINENRNISNGNKYNDTIDKMFKEKLILVKEPIDEKEDEDNETIAEGKIEEQGEQITTHIENNEFPIDRNIGNESYPNEQDEIQPLHKEHQFPSQGLKLLKAAASSETCCDMKKLDAELCRFAEVSLNVIDENMQCMFPENNEMIEKIVKHLKVVDDCECGNLEKLFPAYTGEEDPRISLMIDIENEMDF